MKKLSYQKIEKQRLDKFLLEHLPDLSRGQIQKKIKAGEIKVNDKIVTPHFFLKNNDQINLKLIKEKTKTLSPLIKEPAIIFESSDFLVIDKPAGVLVHPAITSPTKTLVDWLLKNYPQQKNIGDDPTRPGLVHRLDKDVSGLMIIAKSNQMFNYLKQQFKERKIIKKYQALVYGNVKADQDNINFPLSRSKVSGRMVAKPFGQEGREALTEFTVIKRFTNFTLLDINLKTGRRNQIRVHLKAYGHPIVGDKLYKNKTNKDKFELNRIFLHAYYLNFNDLNNTQQEFTCPLPDKLETLLTNLP